jgi:hypothetical protein
MTKRASDPRASGPGFFTPWDLAEGRRLTEWDRCEPVPVDEERERPHDPGGPSGEGAPPGEPDYHLHTELGEETKRLATHPREEAHRLAEELREGETETTPLIAVSGLALWLGVLVAIVIALVFLIARLAS